MQRTVLLLRHGKSDWSAPFSEDAERPLKKRGRRAARAMGRFLAAADAVPDAVLTSPARRARQTLDRAQAAGDWEDVPVTVSDDLYEAGAAAVLEALRGLPDDARRVLLVGHEPTWSQFAARMIGGGALAVPTAALVRIDLEAPYWRDVRFGEGELVWLLPPRLFTDTDIAV